MRYSDYSDWSKIEVAPLGVDSSVYTPRPFRQVCAPYEIVFVGRLAPVKAPHVLLAAVDLLVKAGRDVRLRLVGDGPLRESLEREAHARGLDTRVVFEGWLNQEQVQEVYEKTDVFALASFAEGVPVVLMEAMAREIPSVATFVNGIPQLIRHEVDGLLVAPSDAEQLSSAIARLIDDTALRHRLGEAGRQRVLEKYDLFRNTARLADIFTRHLAPHVSAELSTAKRLVSSQVAAGEIAVE
jgi:glycosyltransferase involved in cell wall biosynthesis